MRRLFILLGALALAACSTPSQRYGLPPPEKAGAYPNVNVDPGAGQSPVRAPEGATPAPAPASTPR